MRPSCVATRITKADVAPGSIRMPGRSKPEYRDLPGVGFGALGWRVKRLAKPYTVSRTNIRAAWLLEGTKWLPKGHKRTAKRAQRAASERGAGSTEPLPALSPGLSVTAGGSWGSAVITDAQQTEEGNPKSQTGAISHVSGLLFARFRTRDTSDVLSARSQTAQSEPPKQRATLPATEAPQTLKRALLLFFPLF